MKLSNPQSSLHHSDTRPQALCEADFQPEEGVGLLQSPIDPQTGAPFFTADEGVYFHLSNGGITFKVTDRSGPTLEITSGSFGNIKSQQTVHTTIDGLVLLGMYLVNAAAYLQFSEPNCHAIEPMGLRSQEFPGFPLKPQNNLVAGQNKGSDVDQQGSQQETIKEPKKIVSVSPRLASWFRYIEGVCLDHKDPETSTIQFAYTVLSKSTQVELQRALRCGLETVDLCFLLNEANNLIQEYGPFHSTYPFSSDGVDAPNLS